jgi:hypothetical protein
MHISPFLAFFDQAGRDNIPAWSLRPLPFLLQGCFAGPMEPHFASKRVRERAKTENLFASLTSTLPLFFSQTGRSCDGDPAPSSPLSPHPARPASRMQGITAKVKVKGDEMPKATYNVSFRPQYRCSSAPPPLRPSFFPYPHFHRLRPSPALS